MDFIGKVCPVCSVGFKEDDDVVVCPVCGAPYHRECYNTKGKCIFPDLHKEKKSWKSVYGGGETAAAEENTDPTVCKHCGHKNSGDSIVCEKCGEFLTDSPESGVNRGSDDDLEKIREQIKNVSPVMGSANFYSSGADPFSFGINRDEDHDGVTAGELMDYVGGNFFYYIPVFSKIKNFNSSRFNFAAFLFGGAWYFYRKQYLKGILITLATLAVSILQGVVTMLWSGALWKNANDALGASDRYVTYQEYAKWITENCSNTDILIMALPYILSFISFVIMILCGIFANKGYYKSSIRSVKKIRERNPDTPADKLKQIITTKGGTNIGAAFMLITCESILSMAILYFFS